MSTCSCEIVTITSSHHWSVKTKLVLQIEIEGEMKIVKREWFDDNKPIIFGDTVQEALDEAEKLFMLIGCSPTYLSLDSNKFTLREIYALLFQLSFPAKDKLQFIHFGTCGCNMGHCAAITGYTLVSEKIDTFGDVLNIWGERSTFKENDHDKKFIFYEYPDSVLLYIRNTFLGDNPIVEIYNDGCYKEPTKVDLLKEIKGEIGISDDDLKKREYFTFSYSR